MADKLLFVDLPSDMPGTDAKRRVSVQRCESCTNPPDPDVMPRFSNPGPTQYVLNRHAVKAPPYHVTEDNVSARRYDVAKATGHHFLRGHGGVVAVYTRRNGKDFSHISNISRAAGLVTPPTSGRPRPMRVSAVIRELARETDERAM